MLLQPTNCVWFYDPLFTSRQIDFGKDIKPKKWFNYSFRLKSTKFALQSAYNGDLTRLFILV